MPELINLLVKQKAGARSLRLSGAIAFYPAPTPLGTSTFASDLMVESKDLKLCDNGAELCAHPDERRATDVTRAVIALDCMPEFGRPNYVSVA